MTQEDKDLLLQDLCGRLPYRVKCKYYDCYEGDYYEGIALGFEREEFIHICGRCIHIEEVKPYLLPLSSMTGEQKKEFKEISKCEYEIRDYGGFDSEGVYLIEIGSYEYEHDINTTFEEFYFNHEIINWLNKNHFDYRGLIEVGLAIDATGLNIY